jgi:DnaJ-class molecular chaperone
MNHYEVLGVSPTATAEEIKRAYKQLVMDHHPDRGGDHNTFAAINAAYEVLRDPQKRAAYDRPPQQDFHFNSGNFGSMNDIFAEFFGNRAGVLKRNRDIQIVASLTLEEVVTGKPVLVNYVLPSGKRENKTIQVPAGVSDGDIIRVNGLGDDSIADVKRGDLLVIVRVLPHPVFTREGDHLIIKQSISVFDLMLGTAVIIEHLTGNSISVNIPAGTQPGTILNVGGRGLVNANTGQTGNLYVQIRGVVPRVSDPDLLERIRSINDEIGDSTGSQTGTSSRPI